MKEEQVGTLFIILAEIACFVCGVYGLIIKATLVAWICFGIGLILPAWLLFTWIEEEMKNASG